MNFCKKCGVKVNESDRFCKSCGTEIPVGKDEAQLPTTQPTGSPIQIEKIDFSLYNKPGFFNKRAGRLFYIITSLVTSGISSSLSTTEDPESLQVLTIVFLIAFSFWLLVANWRLNDLGRSRWWLLGFLIPIVNLIIGLECAFSRGKLQKALHQQKNAKSDLVKCPKCGKEYLNTKVICSNCGTALG